MKKGKDRGYIGPGLSQVIINSESFPLDRPVVFRDGSLVASSDFEELVRDQFVKKKAAFWQAVTLDAGHGGKDPGAISPFNGLQEKIAVLEIAQYAKAYLEQEGVKVHMTRDKDIFQPLESRALVANRSQSNLFVSIHADACAVPEVCGVEVFEQTVGKPGYGKLVDITDAKGDC